MRACVCVRACARVCAALINGTLRDDQDHFKDEMRQLAKQQQNIVGVGSGATADSPWRLDIEQQARRSAPLGLWLARESAWGLG